MLVTRTCKRLTLFPSASISPPSTILQSSAHTDIAIARLIWRNQWAIGRMLAVRWREIAAAAAGVSAAQTYSAVESKCAPLPHCLQAQGSSWVYQTTSFRDQATSPDQSLQVFRKPSRRSFTKTDIHVRIRTVSRWNTILMLKGCQTDSAGYHAKTKPWFLIHQYGLVSQVFTEANFC